MKKDGDGKSPPVKKFGSFWGSCSTGGGRAEKIFFAILT
jgi:hypothetical protein